jgi:hypothetical protein
MGTPPVAGPGTPPVSVLAVAALAAALGVSHAAMLCLVGDALELRHRLPRIWTLVHTGHLQVWKARRIAQATRLLCPAAVGFVDTQAAIAARHNRLPAGPLSGLIHEAMLRHDPDTALGHEEAAYTHRDVEFHYTQSTAPCASADLTATLDLADALDLDNQITHIATTMGRLGDTTPLGTRRAHALGMLANPNHTLNIFGTPTRHHTTSDDPTDPTGGHRAADQPTESAHPAAAAAAGTAAAGTAAAGPATAGAAIRVGAGFTAAAIPADTRTMLSTITTTVYLHITSADLATHLHRVRPGHPGDPGPGATVGASPRAAGPSTRAAGASPGVGVGRVEKLGAGSLGLLADLLTRTPHVVVRPVLDLARVDAVDHHDPPPWMRELVILRDGHCVFPGCTLDARDCDLDHITAYQPPAHGGPPGQTTPDNLACLCRRHHRIKTFTAWTYQRAPTGGYTWTSPHGHRYTTTGTPKT